MIKTQESAAAAEARLQESGSGSEVHVEVRWTVEGGKEVETALTLQGIGDRYLVTAPENAIPDIRPPALPVQSWVEPDSEHLDQAFVPECGGAGLERWCAELSGDDDDRYAMLPFGTYEYTVRSNAIGVAGSPEARIVIGEYDDPEVTLEGDLFDMKPEAVQEIDASLAALAAECPSVGPDKTGSCAHPMAVGNTRLDPGSWKAFNGGVALQLHVNGIAGSESVVLDYSYDGDGGLEPWDPSAEPAE